MAQNILPSGYGGGNSPLFGENMSKSSIAQRRKLANALIAEATKYEASPHWATAVAKGLQGLVGGYQNAAANADEASRNAAISEVVKRLSPEELMQASFQYDEPGLMEMGQFQQRQAQIEQQRQIEAANRAQSQSNWQASYNLQKANIDADNARADASRAAQAPERATITQADGSQVMIERDPLTGQWNPAQVPKGGAAVAPQIANKPPTEDQSKNLGWYNRMVGVGPKLDATSGALVDPVGKGAGSFGWAGNYMKTPEYREAEGYSGEWIATLLRKDSASAVTPQEFEYYGGIYLPQPGDQQADVARKQAARARAVEGIRLGLSAQNIIRDEITRANQEQAVPQSGNVPLQPPDAGWQDTQVPGVRIRRKAM